MNIAEIPSFSAINDVKIKVVEAKPSNPVTGVIYSIPATELKESNVREEWYYTGSAWEKIGGTGSISYAVNVHVTADPDSVTAPDLSDIIVTLTADGVPISGTTDVNGTVTITVDTVDTYAVTYSKEGYAVTGPSTVTITALTQDLNATTYALPTLTVTCTGDDKAGRLITATGGASSITGTTSIDGTCELTGLTVGTAYTVTSDYPDGQGVTPASVSVTGAKGGRHVASFEILDKPVLTVTVLDGSDNNAPLSGLTVTATPQTGTAVTATTNASGQASLTLMAGVAYSVNTGVPSQYYQPATAISKTLAAGVTDTASITLNKYAVLNITQTGASGTVSIDKASIEVTANTKYILTAVGEQYTVSVSAVSGYVTPASQTATAALNATLTLEFEYEEDTPTGGHFWGVVVDESISDCAGMVSYAASLNTGAGTYSNTVPANATPMSGADSLSMGVFGTNTDCAALIAGIKPVSFDGTTWTDLNKTDEASWPSTEGTDCFTEFPFRWLSITKSGDKTTVVFSDSATAPDSTFQNYAFLGADGITQRANFHLGNYAAIGAVSSKKITGGVYSYKGGTSAVSASLNQYWVAAGRRGAEYDCLPYADWVYLQALFLVLYKTTNCQAAHSNGISSGTQTNANAGFTYANDWGMKGTTVDKTHEMAFFWLHNLWGNMYQFSASVFVRAGSTKEIFINLSAMTSSAKWDNSSWDNTSNKALQASIGVTTGSVGSAIGNKYTKACGTNGAGFLPIDGAAAGSDTTYYPDYGSVSSSASYAYFPILGGYYSGDTSVGLFYASVYSNSTSSSSNYGSRLAYRGGHA